jgi:hypothetical protein
LEQAITEVTRHAQLQQSPEIRQTAHRPPEFDACVRAHPGLKHRTDFHD